MDAAEVGRSGAGGAGAVSDIKECCGAAAAAGRRLRSIFGREYGLALLAATAAVAGT